MRKPSTSRRARLWLLAAAFTACTPVSQSYVVHSADLSCDEANRAVYAAIGDMGMKVTSFSPAAPGRTGKLGAVGRDRSGTVTITCDAAGVHVDPNQSTMGDRTFERGIFLSVTGRTGLVMDRGVIVGRNPAQAPVSAQTAPGAAGGKASARGGTIVAQAEAAPPAGEGVSAVIEPQRGFSTVLDFDADLAAAGVLPMKVTIHNGTARSYTFSPDDIIVRVRGSRTSADPLSAADAAAKLAAKAGSEGAQTEIGNVASAKKIMLDKQLKGGKLNPGANVSGYVYYPVGDYDRAKLTMIEDETGEAEGFLVEF
jgi:hypothetical protein